MYNKNLMPRTVEGNSLDDVREELYRLYGANYEILDYKAVIKPGFLHLNEHEVYRVQYVVKDNQFEDIPQGGIVAGQPIAATRPVAAGTPRPLTTAVSARPATVPSVSAYTPRPSQLAAPASPQGDDFAVSKKKLLDSLGGSDSISTQ
ncbi:MAG: hypothetical protein IJU95_09380, partial [Treponema sp.]|nr:hypothetical protein [Treponema sp.]